ncbi:FAD-binding oxidoreductase [Euzebya sp.]|uniref:FAD-binding oxidoreductase n=1 Tax=Euzebya sp. TaxID=1971409 RepID=UPI00351292C3
MPATPHQPAVAAAHVLTGRIAGEVLLPGSEAFAAAAQPWNTAIRQHPALIVRPATASDVAHAVVAARDHQLQVAVMATGHGVARPADDCLLVDLSPLTDVTVDAEARTATIGGGTTWGPVLEAAQRHGLAPLLGSSPGVGAVGYTLGGGLGWLARKHGPSVDRVRRLEVVTADGAVVEASPTSHPDLFWALRGGGGAFGIVTAMEIDLVEVTTVYAGNLLYPAAMAHDVLRRWAAWVPDLPDELTTSVVLMNFPPFDEVPAPLRGQSFAMVRGCWCGDPAEGKPWIDAWRAWAEPAMDLFGPMPFAESAAISNDPLDPTPAASTTEWLRELSDEVVDVLVRGSFGGDGPPPVVLSEVRHVGGVVATAPADAGAYGHRDAELLLFVLAAVPEPDAARHVEAHLRGLRAQLEPWVTGGAYVNFTEGAARRDRTRQAFADDAWDRLRRVKAAYDPDEVFQHALDIPPAPPCATG